MVMKYDQQNGKWTVDRHIPVAVLIAILIQTVGIVVWAARFTATTETRLAVLEKQVDSMAAVNERLSKLESVTTNNADMLREIRNHILQR